MNEQFHSSWFNCLCTTVNEDTTRKGLVDTPSRLARSWQYLLKGYQDKPGQILSAVFPAEGYDELVVLRDIEFFSTCEHHLLPFFGKAHIGYLPGSSVVGISKLARLVDCFARRLQTQERLTSQIADAINTNLEPRGVAVVIDGVHLCMRARGVEKQNSEMTTSALRGLLREEGARSEFLKLIGGQR